VATRFQDLGIIGPDGGRYHHDMSATNILGPMPDVHFGSQTSQPLN
jgi:hypothetical protein